MCKKTNGFTLLEILIALFVFTIVSMIMVSTLHNIMTTQSVTEKNTARFNQLQMTLILISHDVEQIINRPITNNTGSPETGIVGSPKEITFTHMGLANPFGVMNRSTLQRVHYFLQGDKLIRETWPELDATSDTHSSQRSMLNEVSELHFQYLDQHGKFQDTWTDQATLPSAIRIIITLKNEGNISQLYLVPGQTFGS